MASRTSIESPIEVGQQVEVGTNLNLSLGVVTHVSGVYVLVRLNDGGTVIETAAHLRRLPPKGQPDIEVGIRVAKCVGRHFYFGTVVDHVPSWDGLVRVEWDNFPASSVVRKSMLWVNPPINGALRPGDRCEAGEGARTYHGTVAAIHADQTATIRWDASSTGHYVSDVYSTRTPVTHLRLPPGSPRC